MLEAIVKNKMLIPEKLKEQFIEENIDYTKITKICYPDELEIIPSISIDLTNKCNFDCSYCVKKTYKRPNINFITEKTMDDIAHCCHKIKKIDWNFLGGEPLLHKNITKFASKFLQLPNTDHVFILSNGSIKFDKFKDILHPKLSFNITYHNYQYKNYDVQFLHNVKFLINNKIDHCINFKLDNENAMIMYKKLIDIDDKINISNLYIDLKNNKNEFLSNSFYYFNNKKIRENYLFKLRLIYYKDWYCKNIALTFNTDGTFYRTCFNDKGDAKKDIIDNDMFYFRKCPHIGCPTWWELRFAKFKY